jgi:hypothetical protein
MICIPAIAVQTDEALDKMTRGALLTTLSNCGLTGCRMWNLDGYSGPEMLAWGKREYDGD